MLKLTKTNGHPIFICPMEIQAVEPVFTTYDGVEKEKHCIIYFADTTVKVLEKSTDIVEELDKTISD